VRGEAEGVDFGDEGRDCGSAAAESGGNADTAGSGEKQEKRKEERKEESKADKEKE